MKVTTKARYSIRAMVDLALCADEQAVSLKRIAGRQNISERYLEQLFISLRAASLVKGIPGASGGFSLIRPPQEIKISEIILATEGSIALLDCVDNPRLCPRSDSCAIRNMWSMMKREMEKVLGSITLHDLVNQQKQKVRLSRGKNQKPFYKN